MNHRRLCDGCETARHCGQHGCIPVTVTRLTEWRLEFQQDGYPFVWSGCAPSAEAAENTARADLAQDQAAFNASTARLVACHQR